MSFMYVNHKCLATKKLTQLLNIDCSIQWRLSVPDLSAQSMAKGFPHLEHMADFATKSCIFIFTSDSGRDAKTPTAKTSRNQLDRMSRGSQLSVEGCPLFWACVLFWLHTRLQSGSLSSLSPSLSSSLSSSSLGGSISTGMFPTRFSFRTVCIWNLTGLLHQNSKNTYKSSCNIMSIMKSNNRYNQLLFFVLNFTEHCSFLGPQHGSIGPVDSK